MPPAKRKRNAVVSDGSDPPEPTQSATAHVTQTAVISKKMAFEKRFDVQSKSPEDILSEPICIQLKGHTYVYTYRSCTEEDLDFELLQSLPAS